MPDAERSEFVIPRHAVPSGPRGLSPMQTTMLDAPEPVRVCSAPTGAGKSHAFQVAMRERGARILFIVPTRRLAQNLAEGLRQDLIDGGMPPDRINDRVCVWTSDERRRLQGEDPATDVTRRRIREIRQEANIPDGGVMIIATPESVAWYMLNPRFTAGGSDVQGIMDLLRLDHVVFDEFHTIEARGMGLCMAVATFLAHGASEAKLTFLSATPIDLVTPLVHFGIPREKILVASETVVTGSPEETAGMRAIHGDVTVAFRQDGSMVDALEACREDIVGVLAAPRDSKAGQVVLIFDSLRDLLGSRKAIAEWFDAIGVGPEDRLAINSTDDSTDSAFDGLFTSGQAADPLRFRVLVATSSVEMGVTFRAGMIVMNPGHDPCSFVQRIGRVARGDTVGKVVVTSFRPNNADPAWFRMLRRHLLKGPEVLQVDSFLDVVLSSIQAKFAVVDADLEQMEGVFRRMPQSAAWAGALFWCALEAVMQERGHRGMRETLRHFRPRKAAAIGAWLRELGEIDLHCARRWREAFLLEARKLRMIVPGVVLVDPMGHRRSLPWHLYAADPYLSTMPAREGDDGSTGGRRLEVMIDRPVAVVLQELQRVHRVRQREEVLLPHDGATPLLEVKALVDSALKIFRSAERDPALTRDRQKARQIGERLVRLTRIVPTLEGAREADGASGIL